MAQLSELSPLDFPATFECPTGELVFGQVQCIFEGLQSPDHLKRGLPERLETGGTILQSKLHYRVAARSGTWKVSRVYSGCILANENGVEQEKKYQIGFVVHHESVSAAEYLKRAAIVGVNYNNTIDDQIVYVNRYDWSWQHGSRTIINAALHPSRPWTVRKIDSLLGGRLIVLDASRGDQFKDLLRSSFLEGKCYSFSKTNAEGSQAERFGIHLVSQPIADTEYELGWIGFSGQKHATFTDSDEAVAFVYDGAYDGLRLEAEGHNLKLYAEEEMAMSGDQLSSLGLPTGVPAAASDEEGYVTDPALSELSEDNELGPIDSDEDDDYDDALEEGELASLALPDSFPPPTISSVVAIWGLGIAIHGSTFRPTTVIEINDCPVPFEVVSNTLIHTRVPAGVSGQLAIRVHNPTGSSDVVTYDHPPVPVIDHIAPNTGSKWGSTFVSIHGFSLNAVGNILFDGIPALDLERVSDTQINVRAPAYLGWNYSARVTVEDKSGKKSFMDDPDYDLCVVNPKVVSFVYEDVPPMEYTTALRTFKQILQEEPRAFEARTLLAEVHGKSGDHASCIPLWEEAVALDVADGDALHNLASAFAANGEYDKAIEMWNRALEAGHDEKELFVGMGEVYSKIGDGAKAEEIKADGDRLWS